MWGNNTSAYFEVKQWQTDSFSYPERKVAYIVSLHSYTAVLFSPVSTA